jgi:hypothetical protein
MTNPTSNFGWQMPTSTDLVTDLPADFEVFGQAVDTSLADLKGGTTGQVLKKNSNTDMDFVWSADSAGMTNPMTTTGDTIYSSSGSTPARLGIGTTGQVLTVAGGLPAWSTPGGSLDNYQLLNAGGTALTGTNTITISGISGKNSLWVYVVDVSSASASSNIIFRLNADSGSNYNFSKLVFNNSSMAVAGGNDASFPFAQTGNRQQAKSTLVLQNLTEQERQELRLTILGRLAMERRTKQGSLAVSIRARRQSLHFQSFQALAILTRAQSTFTGHKNDIH